MAVYTLLRMIVYSVFEIIIGTYLLQEIYCNNSYVVEIFPVIEDAIIVTDCACVQKGG